MTGNDHSFLLLDGAKGTELGRRGVDLSLPLWSARGLLDAPEILASIHRDYLHAGAGIVIANTFRTSKRALQRADMEHEAERLTKLAVEIARRERDAVDPQRAVLGCVAPLEDCWHPERAPDEVEAERAHEWMISCLRDAGVDGLAIETMGTEREAIGAARAAERLMPGKWMLSFCFKSGGPPGMLLSGESVIDVLPMLDGAHAVGVNCVSAPAVEIQVRLLRHLLPDHVRIVAYANVGGMDDAGRWVQSDAVDPVRYAAYARRWRDGGASIIGGCCGTTPATIELVGRTLGGGAG